MGLSPHRFLRSPSRRTIPEPLPLHPLTLAVERSLITATYGFPKATPPRRSRHRRRRRPFQKTGARIFIRRAKSLMTSTKLHNDTSKKVDDAHRCRRCWPDHGQGNAFAGASHHSDRTCRNRAPEGIRTVGEQTSTTCRQPPSHESHHNTSCHNKLHATAIAVFAAAAIPGLPPRRPRTSRRASVHRRT